MTPLEQEIRSLIEQDGPLSIATYMSLCLTHPEHGYYTSGSPIGGRASPDRTGGDFITAPEVSQMFGELIGVWCMEMWKRLGTPSSFNLVEVGPGRGTLMSDLLRAAKSLPKFYNAAHVQLVEISPTLRKRQKQALENCGKQISWLTEFNDSSNLPTIVIGNELLDTLPFRQWVKTENDWQERCIGLIEDKLAFVPHPAKLDLKILPPDHEQQAIGTVLEVSPAREALVSKIAHQLMKTNGVALLIDYGHLETGYGDTFQALRDHAYVDPLEAPGKADLTNHVDFAPLQTEAIAGGCVAPKLTSQGQFLLNLGLLERAGALGAEQDEQVQNTLRQAVERLASPKQMGDLFKVMAFGAPAENLQNWPGFE